MKDEKGVKVIILNVIMSRCDWDFFYKKIVEIIALNFRVDEIFVNSLLKKVVCI